MSGQKIRADIRRETGQRVDLHTNINADLQRIRAAVIRVESNLALLGNLPAGNKPPVGKRRLVIEAK